MKSTPKKLRLSRQIVRSLAAADLADAAGGSLLVTRFCPFSGAACPSINNRCLPSMGPTCGP